MAGGISPMGCFCMDCILTSLAIITEYHRLDGLNKKHFLVTVMESRKSKIKVLQTCGLVRACFLVVDGHLVLVSSHG